MNTTELIVLVVFLSVFIQVWIIVGIKKAQLMMLKERFSKAKTKGLTLEQAQYQIALLDEYRDTLSSFIHRLITISFLINLSITITVCHYIQR